MLLKQLRGVFFELRQTLTIYGKDFAEENKLAKLGDAIAISKSANYD